MCVCVCVCVCVHLLTDKFQQVVVCAYAYGSRKKSAPETSAHIYFVNIQNKSIIMIKSILIRQTNLWLVCINFS